MRTKLLFLALLSSILLCAQGNMELGRRYYNNIVENRYYNSYQKNEWGQNAVSYLQSAAKEGYGEACYYLGHMYSDGEFVTRDYQIAMNMYKKSLEFGYEKGNTEIGDMYFYGRGVKKNYPQAIEYYHKSIDNEISSGKHMLGVCYYHGWGVPADTAQAYSYLKRFLVESRGERGCHVGHPAFYVLANMLADGLQVYVENDKVLINCVENTAMLLHRTNKIEHMQEAAELLYCNNGGTFTWYGYNTYSGNEDIISGYRVTTLLEDMIALTDDYPENYYMYAMRVLFTEIYGRTAQKPVALKYLELAANKGVDKATRMVASMYEKGIWVSKNTTIAAKYKEQWTNQIKNKSEIEQQLLLDPVFRNSFNIYNVGDTYIHNGEKCIVVASDCSGKPTLLLPLDYSLKKYDKKRVATLDQLHLVWIYMDDINTGLVREGAKPLDSTTYYRYSEYGNALFRFSSRQSDSNNYPSSSDFFSVVQL